MSVTATAAPFCHAAASVASNGAAAVFAAGLLSALMPCTVQMSMVLSTLVVLPGRWSATSQVQAGLGRRGSAGRLVAFASAYIATFGVAAVVASAVVATVGLIAGERIVAALGAVALLAIGLHVFGFVRLPGGGPCRGPVSFFLGRRHDREPHPSYLGAGFAVYCAGCCGPSALAAASLVAHGGSLLATAALLFAFGAGMAVPFAAVASTLWYPARDRSRLLRYAPTLAVFAAGFSILMGSLTLVRLVGAILGA